DLAVGGVALGLAFSLHIGADDGGLGLHGAGLAVGHTLSPLNFYSLAGLDGFGLGRGVGTVKADRHLGSTVALVGGDGLPGDPGGAFLADGRVVQRHVNVIVGAVQNDHIRGGLVLALLPAVRGHRGGGDP